MSLGVEVEYCLFKLDQEIKGLEYRIESVENERALRAYVS
jgi:hypothetical protein